MEEIWAAIIGVGGTLLGVALGAVVTIRLATAQQRATKMHESRLALYADAFADGHVSEERIEGLLDRLNYRKALVAPDRATITGRMMLLAPDEVQTAWRNYVDAEERFTYYLREESQAYNREEDLDPGEAQVVAFRKSIDDLYATVRANFTE